MTAELRASNADRDRVATELQRHAGTGRLTVDESGERIALAHQARTLADLEQLTRDLPHQPPETPPRPHAAPPITGMAAFGAMLTIIVFLGIGLTPMCG